MGMGIMWRICTVSGKKCSLYAKPLGEMIAERLGVHGFGYEMKTGLCLVQILLDWIQDEENSICIDPGECTHPYSYPVRGGICEDFGA